MIEFVCSAAERIQAADLLGVSSLDPVFWGDKPKSFTISPDFDFGVNASREGPMEKIPSLGEKWHWHDVALSEHRFHAPKRLTHGVCFHTLGAMGTVQMCTSRYDCVHCDLLRPWVFRSSIEAFKPLFGPVAAERDVKQFEHHIA